MRLSCCDVEQEILRRRRKVENNCTTNHAEQEQENQKNFKNIEQIFRGQANDEKRAEPGGGSDEHQQVRATTIVHAKRRQHLRALRA